MGSTTLLAIDSDKWACGTYRANFPDVRVECGKVADFVSSLPDCDVILSGPPCQPFSDAGENEGESDERDCIPDFIAAVAAKRPRQFLMENVRGLLKSRHWPYFCRVIEQLESLGFRVEWKLLDAVNFGVPQFRERVWVWGIRSDIAARHCWPKPTHSWPPPDPCMFGAALLAGITVRDALGMDGLLRRDRGAGLIDRGGERRDHPTDEPSPSIAAGQHASGPRLTLMIDTKQHRTLRPADEPATTVGSDDRRILIQSHADPAQDIDRPAPTLRSGGNGHDGRCLRVIGGGSNPHFIGDVRTGRDITDEPSPTIPCGDHFGNVLPQIEYDHGVATMDRPSPTIKAGGNYDASGKQGGGCPPIVAYHWSDAMLEKHPPASPASPAPTVQAKWAKGGAEGLLAVTKWKQKGELWVRRPTPLECLRLQSGPDDFRWPDSIPKTHAYRVVGNGWASRMGAVFSDAIHAADPLSRTVIDLFCGGGLGAVGWHGRAWEFHPESEVA
jgi:site-specific DNA-cytosine methylase